MADENTTGQGNQPERVLANDAVPQDITPAPNASPPAGDTGGPGRGGPGRWSRSWRPRRRSRTRPRRRRQSWDAVAVTAIVAGGMAAAAATMAAKI